MGPSPFAALLQVIRAFETLGITYSIGGSLASSLYGTPRSTNDADVIADVTEQHVAPLVSALEADFMVDSEAIQEALASSSSFNMIHVTSMDKIDIFVSGQVAWRVQQLRRRRTEPLLPTETSPLAYFNSPEDTILAKLAWYRLGNETSERQWADILAVLSVQGPALDRDYLREWAARLDVADLLARALQQQGSSPWAR
jgi:hypothetical protein